jgi:hypothetical protein
VFCYCQIKKGLTVHILDSVLRNVASGIVFKGLGDKFHGDLIPKGCYTIMLSSIFQGKAKLQYPNHNEDPPHV